MHELNINVFRELCVCVFVFCLLVFFFFCSMAGQHSWMRFLVAWHTNYLCQTNVKVSENPGNELLFLLCCLSCIYYQLFFLQFAGFTEKKLFSCTGGHLPLVHYLL